MVTPAASPTDAATAAIGRNREVRRRAGHEGIGGEAGERNRDEERDGHEDDRRLRADESNRGRKQEQARDERRGELPEGQLHPT
jgi:hypothetical protein